MSEPLEDARTALEDLMFKHHAAALPAMIAACIGWAIEHGAGDLIRVTLENGIKLIPNAEKAFAKERN